MNDIIKVVIVDDNTLYRKAVSEVFSSDPQIKIIGQGSTAEEAVSLANVLKPDIILIDLGMPGGGLASAWKVKSNNPKTRVVILTASDAEDDIREAQKAGVCAYILKGVSARDLVKRIHQVWMGDCPGFQGLK